MSGFMVISVLTAYSRTVVVRDAIIRVRRLIISSREGPSAWKVLVLVY